MINVELRSGEVLFLCVLLSTNFTLDVPTYAFGQTPRGSVREFCTTFSHSSVRVPKQHRTQKNVVFAYNYAYAYTQKRKNAYNIDEVKQNGYKRCYCRAIYTAVH